MLHSLTPGAQVSPATGKTTCPTARQEEVQVGQHRRGQVVKGLVTVTRGGNATASNTRGDATRSGGHKEKGNMTRCRGHKEKEVAS